MDLKVLRVQKRWKQSDLAERLGWSCARVAKLERAQMLGLLRKVLRVEDAVKLAAVFNVDWREFYADVETTAAQESASEFVEMDF